MLIQVASLSLMRLSFKYTYIYIYLVVQNYSRILNIWSEYPTYQYNGSKCHLVIGSCNLCLIHLDDIQIEKKKTEKKCGPVCNKLRSSKKSNGFNL